MRARSLLVAGLVLACIALASSAAAPADALRAWLAAAFLWSGVPIGSLGLIMMIRLIGGRWGHTLLLPLEAGALTLPIVALALLPVLAGVAILYPWVGIPASGFKGVWLSSPLFILRTLVLFAGLGAALWALVTRRGAAVAISSAGLLFLAPMMSIVAVDWLASLDPEFHSSGFGLYALSIQFTVALMVAVWILLGRQPDRVATLASIVITLILIWLYLAFTSYFIVWSGDLTDVVGWYKIRGVGGWGIAFGLSAAIEAVAFVILLHPRARRSALALRTIAAVVILGKAVEAAWLVLPEAGPMRIVPVALFALATIGLGLVVVQAQQVLLNRRIVQRVPA